VTTMNGTFSGNSAFNQDIGSWDVSNVTTMNGTFRGNSAFNQDISSWDVSNVADVRFMFNTATAFNQDLSSWQVNGIYAIYCDYFSTNATAWTLPKPNFTNANCTE